MKNSQNNRILMGIMLVVVMYGCSDAVGTIDYAEPPVVPGNRSIEISVTTEAGDELSGYDLTITGPTSANVTNSGSSTYTLSNIASGDYTIKGSKTGFVDRTVVTTVTLPGEIGDDYFGNVAVSLSPKVVPQTISNAAPVTVNTAPAPGETTPSITANIPANTFPASVVDANGNVNFGITRASASDNTTTSVQGGTAIEVFEFEPANVELNNPIEMSLSIEFPDGVNPASIPYVLEGEDGSILELELDDSAAKSAVNPDGSISGFNIYVVGIPTTNRRKLVPRITFTRSSGQTRSVVLGSSPACGAGFTSVYEHSRFEAVNTEGLFYLDNYARLSLIFEIRAVTKSITGIPGFRQTLRVNKPTTNYEFSNGKTFTVNQTSYTFETIRTACHNGGGGD